ncbi:MAG: acyltransferase family protein [Lachnospiraceae bacterium]|nr:acyltransferase family protein [Lachnospiraceae bacterium]
MNAKRENWIDVAKAIAILAIIVGHVGGTTFRFAFSFNVTAFLILSGYTISKKYGIKEFINQKFNRLMIPYFMTCFVVILLDLFNNVFLYGKTVEEIKDAFATDLVRSFFASGTYTNFGKLEIGSRIGAIWFLPAMFFALLIFRLLLQWTEDLRILGVVTFLIAAVGYVTGPLLWLPFSIQSGMFSTFFLWLGYVAKRYDLVKLLKWYIALPALAIFVFGAYKGISPVWVVTASATVIYLSPIFSIFGCLVIFYLSRLLEKAKWIGFIGQQSMTILCLHLISLETLGDYFYKILEILGLEGKLRSGVNILLYIAFAVLGALVLAWLKGKPYAFYKKIAGWRSSAASASGERERTVDIMRGILILAMLVGHFYIDPTLRKIIYSCHMEAFVLLSGYFYRKKDHFGKSVLHMLRTFLLPYGIFVVIHMLLDVGKWSVAYFTETLKTYALGMSYSDKILTDISSVGPVYFILLLFLVRLIYMLLDRICKNEIVKAAVIVVLTVAGALLGRGGLWLPWSFDCVLYSMFFYYIGVLFQKYKILDFLKDHHIFYFILSPVWAVMIYFGSMELAIRQYAPYLLVIIGALCGIAIIYRFSAYLNRALVLSSRILNYIGKSTIYLLVVHVLLNSRMLAFCEGRGINSAATMILCIGLQVIISVIVYGLHSIIKRAIKSKTVEI